MTSVRVRGVYATALTAALGDAGHEVVAASPPIRERFAAEFPEAEPAVRVAATADRQGVVVTGDADAAATVTDDLVALGVDALSWAAPAARDAVFAGEVVATDAGGAVVSLDGECEGYLPAAVPDGVSTGDALTVQVRSPSPPWREDRPRLGTEVRVSGALATLVRGVDAAVADTPRGGDDLAAATELLSADVPSAWGVRWERDAVEAPLDALNDALATATDRARVVEAALAADRSAPSRVAAPLATHWVWFGRATRSACDEARAPHAPTMAGHHRTKAAASAASDAVDLVERIGDPPESFPFGAVTATFGPRVGDEVDVGHGKPDGRLLSLGPGEVTDRDPGAESITVRREMGGRGTYDGLGVPQAPGDVATTTFREGRWWYPTTYRDAEGSVKGTYVNVCTPVEIFPAVVRYVDLHVDVLKHADGTVEVVDEEELAAADVSAELAEKARSVATRIADGLR